MPYSGKPERADLDPGGTAPLPGPDRDVAFRLGGLGPAATDATGATDRFAGLMGLLDDLVWCKDPQGRYLCCNPAMLRRLGPGPSAVAGALDDALFPPEAAAALVALDRDVLAHGQGRAAEVWLALPDRTRALYAVREMPLQAADGSVTGLLGLARDITDQRQTLDALRQSEARIRALFDATSDSVILADPRGRVLAINAHGARRRGLTPQTMIGKSLYRHLPPEAARQRRACIDEVLATGRPQTYEEERHGSRYAINIYPVLDELGHSRQVASFSRDITARCRAEDAIRRLNESLELRVQERTEQLERANQELTRTLRDLTDAQKKLVESEKMASLGGLVAGVAHEINTPVGIGVTAASHLEDKTRRLLTAYEEGGLTRTALESYLVTCEESTRMILSNLSRAAELIRGFKQVAVDQSSEQRRVFRLGAYLREVLLSLRPRLKKTRHSVTVTCDTDLTMDSYPGAISQIITNLVLNSLMHAFAPEKAGQITITARSEGANIRLVYADDGKGMAAEQLARIFEPFYTTMRGRGGTGLGLNVLYNLVTQRLGGTVACQSEPGCGTTFTMLLPREERTA